mmetsp:Transcript_18287/g.30705  ORF Transcript_18287/g.30705 Transcript_18287/m.30705 type:complete len:210 (-) Transcript_18287:71-700(-)
MWVSYNKDLPDVVALDQVRVVVRFKALDHTRQILYVHREAVFPNAQLTVTIIRVVTKEVQFHVRVLRTHVGAFAQHAAQAIRDIVGHAEHELLLVRGVLPTHRNGFKAALAFVRMDSECAKHVVGLAPDACRYEYIVSYINVSYIIVPYRIVYRIVSYGTLHPYNRETTLLLDRHSFRSHYRKKPRPVGASCLTLTKVNAIVATRSPCQ